MPKAQKGTFRKINTLTAGLTFAVATFLVSTNTPVYADCEPNYGGGETCICNKVFRIEKKVAKLDTNKDLKDHNFEDKVIFKTPEKSSDVKVVFKIKVTNEGEVTTDDMKMKDSLPDEFQHAKSSFGGDGLTETWDDFEPGESKTFYITAKLEKDEFVDDKNYEKCVVNEASVYYDGDFEGKDTATVCFRNSEITELPETGPVSTAILTALGLTSIASGFGLKSRYKR
ncbi:MAG: LPXTG cell wall anchor domain-containing protein [Patescibacteria group bacterium]